MQQDSWRQVNIAYPGGSRAERERHAIDHLTRAIPAAGHIATWWFVRKGPWRIRYQPAAEQAATSTEQLLVQGMIWTPDIYEPEVHAFGGVEAMAAAHALFHADSSHLLRYLHNNPADRREMSLLLATALMRAAGLDLEEQGDVWACVAEHRADLLNDTPTPDVLTWTRYVEQTRTLLCGIPRSSETDVQWLNAFSAAGQALQHLRSRGSLTRGLRAVITKHVIFHWNRIGIPGRAQAQLASAAKDAILGTPQHIGWLPSWHEERVGGLSLPDPSALTFQSGATA
ncbi:hypothetical protein Rhe02_81380 [Rhizocola hellebori]|uniref:Thiopeptide-type bacteriocin biosynthesis domain-containing protein n=1 Tax=Rhizocola hellebori TaxID=1392758 RepID=A0A8J3QIX5_9ACTN|nr:thiopeptide-type bacteriocin biosynthesis protein [Rhizocola hellebori]GIH10071.1 hypothetical protein Rhe02_81380 [Rhizocola hellebori]